jgi:hypothetical protein
MIKSDPEKNFCLSEIQHYQGDKGGRGMGKDIKRKTSNVSPNPPLRDIFFPLVYLF